MSNKLNVDYFQMSYICIVKLKKSQNMKTTIRINNLETYEVEIKVRDIRNLNASKKALHMLFAALADKTYTKNETMELHDLLYKLSKI